jgi:hypothetical protein
MLLLPRSSMLQGMDRLCGMKRGLTRCEQSMQESTWMQQAGELNPWSWGCREIHVRGKTVLVNGVLVYLRPHVLRHDLHAITRWPDKKLVDWFWKGNTFSSIQFSRTQWTRLSKWGGTECDWRWWTSIDWAWRLPGNLWQLYSSQEWRVASSSGHTVQSPLHSTQPVHPQFTIPWSRSWYCSSLSSSLVENGPLARTL